MISDGRNFFGPASSQHYNSGGGGGGVHRKKKIKIALATRTQNQPAHRIWGGSVKAPGSSDCHKLGSAIF